ncbi:hypothetical protein K7X08_010299 [Anisodus acutangulus]|uniref:Uncharacterized protein n=1 Tax=Anisodus acutangulus TaxID=402998 RepID=A0A9Q1RVM0_9SOLA|nr:hypothetical protein K7X08_010299 [Anisodus acutangulus]
MLLAEMLIEEAKRQFRTQLVDYDWWPEYCQDCMCLGHETKVFPLNTTHEKRKNAGKDPMLKAPNPGDTLMVNPKPGVIQKKKKQKPLLTQWQAKDVRVVGSSYTTTTPKEQTPTQATSSGTKACDVDQNQNIEHVVSEPNNVIEPDPTLLC